MVFDNNLFNKIIEQAENSPRLRMNFNVHKSLDEKVQKLFNVLLPGTDVPIHRHLHTEETYIILKGKLFVVFYDDLGGQTERILLDPSIGNFGINIPKGQWHSIEVLLPSVIFEVKEGPYKPLEPEDLLF